MVQTGNTKALFIIVNAGHADDVIEIARSEGAGGATILNARASARGMRCSWALRWMRKRK
mgnify:CR=1 FL=1|jgi:hypothetical protein